MCDAVHHQAGHLNIDCDDMGELAAVLIFTQAHEASRAASSSKRRLVFVCNLMKSLQKLLTTFASILDRNRCSPLCLSDGFVQVNNLEHIYLQPLRACLLVKIRAIPI